MKKLVATFAMAVALALSFNGVAHAYTNAEQAFLDALHSDGINGADAEAISVGHSYCHDVKLKGRKVAQAKWLTIIADQNDATDSTKKKEAFTLGAAQSAFCSKVR